MPAQSARYGQPDPGEPVIHELPSLRFGGAHVSVRLAVRRDEGGAWRGRLLFGPGDAAPAPTTAEIFFGVSEADLWESVRDLREHHLRDLYRSLVE